mmetsp:Transcript_73422/g.146056  ORF Transcript_73422/g.146056 Transcript_73422/m.146056 type:complete len:213 (-) Transcript_73422:509-1147(-)
MVHVRVSMPLSGVVRIQQRLHLTQVYNHGSDIVPVVALLDPPLHRRPCNQQTASVDSGQALAIEIVHNLHCLLIVDELPHAICREDEELVVFGDDVREDFGQGDQSASHGIQIAERAGNAEPWPHVRFPFLLIQTRRIDLAVIVCRRPHPRAFGLKPSLLRRHVYFVISAQLQRHHGPVLAPRTQHSAAIAHPGNIELLLVQERHDGTCARL